MMMPDDLIRALERLPHGSGFRFVDRLLELVPGVSGRAEYTLKGDEPFLSGHFPNNPLMPGVILVESVAQLSGIVVQGGAKHCRFNELRLTAIQNAKILGSLHPGQTMLLEAQIEGVLGGLIQASGSVEIEGESILRTRLTLSGSPNALHVANS